MVAGVFVVLLVTAGLGFYNASVILKAAKDELDTSVTAVSGATGLFFGISGIASFLVARRMQEIDLRWFYVAGGIVGGVALTGLRWVNSVFDLYLFFALFGVGFALAGLVPGTTVVARWFHVRRSVALSIATTGLSVGGIAITPFAASFIDDRTLAGAGPWMGLAWILGVIPISLLLIRSDPADLGLEPDGVPTTTGVAGDAARALPGASFAQAISTRFFRYLAATYALVFMAQVGAIAQLFNLADERINSATAATALSTMAFSSIVGRLIGGIIVARISTKRLTGFLIIVQGVALVIIALSTTTPVLILGVAILGLSVGNLLMLQPLLLAETFGVREYSRIYSFSQLFGTIGVAGGPLLLGALRDLLDYRGAFLIASVGNMIGFVLLHRAGSIEDARQTWAGAEPVLG